MDDIDKWDWVEDPVLGVIPVPKGSAPQNHPNHEMPLEDPLYTEKRQDLDDEMAQRMEPAPEHPVPYEVTDGEHNRVKLSAEQLSGMGRPVKRRTIRRLKDGTVETHEDDGTVRTEYIDGTVTTRHPCGRVETQLNESTVDGETETTRHTSRLQQTRNAMKFTDEVAPTDQERRKRILRGRRAGPSLPSSAARRLAEAGEDSEEERPDVLMVGGRNVLPEMQRELDGMARRCELGMRPGAQRLMHDERSLEAPSYMRHFAGESLRDDWAAPELDVDREEREWRRQLCREQRNPDRKTDRELLLQEYKFRKGIKRTEVEEEEWNFERPERQDAFSERLQKLQQDLAEEKARAAKREAKVKTRKERLAREAAKAEEVLAKEEEEEDLENRVYPDAVPAYLIDRPQYFFYPSRLPGNRRVLAVAQQPVVVAVGETSKTSKGGKAQEESDDDIEVVDAPPDTVDVY
jgi:hypothetical protein